MTHSIYDLLRDLVTFADKNTPDPGSLHRKYFPVIEDAERKGVFGTSADELGANDE